MKSIRILKSGKLFKELPWTAQDETFFRQYEGYMISEGMSLSIIDPPDELPPRSIVARFLFIGKIKQDRIIGDVRWAKAIVKESSIPTVTESMELMVKIPAGRVDTYFTAGLPNDYVILNTVSPSAEKFIHHYSNIIQFVERPTTTVTSSE